MSVNTFHNPDFDVCNLPQVSEQQLNDAIAQAVENSKLRKDRSQWSIDGEILIVHYSFSRTSDVCIAALYCFYC